MRPLRGTSHTSTASAPAQFGTTTFNQRVVYMNAKARAGNGTAIYIGNSSTVNSTNGYELANGDALNEDYRDNDGNGSVAGNTLWFICSSTTDNLDWSIGVADDA